jgi:hypothetical protein
MARGFGEQLLMVFPKRNLIVVFTGWTILGDTPPLPEYVARIRSALKSRDCTQP